MVGYGLAILAFAFMIISFPVEAAEDCQLEICKGEKVIVYDSNHKRIGTIENRGYGRTQIA